MQVKNITISRKNSKLYEVINAKLNNKTDTTPKVVTENLVKVLLDIYCDEIFQKSEGDNHE